MNNCAILFEYRRTITYRSYRTCLRVPLLWSTPPHTIATRPPPHPSSTAGDAWLKSNASQLSTDPKEVYLYIHNINRRYLWNML